jgi:hypothetical protein
MTIDKREVITIPKWLVIVLIPIIMGSIGGFAVGRFDAGRNSKQIEVNTKRLDVVERNKVDMETFKVIEGSLQRIEDKLDKHIDKN